MRREHNGPAVKIIVRVKTRVRAIFWLILLLNHAAVFGAADAPRPQRRFDFARGVGIVAARQGGDYCLLIQNSSLKPGDGLALVWVPLADGTQPGETRHSRVSAGLKQPCDAANAAAADASYLVDGGNLENGKVYFALAGNQASLKLRQGQVEGRLGGRPVAFSACASTEGIHLNIWMGTARTGRKLWHRYYYLGYDVEPTCTEVDSKE